MRRVLLLLALLAGCGKDDGGDTAAPVTTTGAGGTTPSGTTTAGGTTTPSGTTTATTRQDVELGLGDADAVWEGIAPGQSLLYAAAVGDVDGDGVSDHLFHNVDGLTEFSGWLVSGALTGSGPVDQRALAHLDISAAAHPDFGAVGDVDGDGVADLSVSDQSDPTSVYLVSGALRGTVDPYASSIATIPLTWTTRTWADVDGDGADEFFALERDPSVTDVQRAYLLPGGQGGVIDANIDMVALVETELLPGLDSALLERLERADLDGDGVPELVASDFRWGSLAPDGITQIAAGRVLAWSTPLFAKHTPDDAILDLHPPDSQHWELGFDLATGDLDGDGSVDLAVAARGGQGMGGAFVFLDPLSATGLQDADVEVPGLYTVRTGFGVGLEDLSGDGADDLAVHALDGPGALWVFEDPASGVLTEADARIRVVGTGPGDQLSASGAVGDFDGDGVGDAMLGAPGAVAGMGGFYLFGGPLVGP